MNNYYTLRFLASEFKNVLTGCRFQKAVSFRKNRLDLYFSHNAGDKKMSVFAASQNTALFLVSPQPHKKKNFATFFASLEDVEISNCSIAESDRFLYLHFTNGAQLLFRMFGPVPNIFLIQNEIITESFKKNEQFSGQPPPEPSAADSKNAEWKGKPKAYMLALNPALPRTGLDEVISQNNLENGDPVNIKQFTEELSASLKKNALPWLTADKALCTFPESYLRIERPYKYNTFNEAVKEAYFSSSYRQQLHQKKSEISRLLSKQIKKLTSRIKQLQKAEKGVERAGRYEEFGHLLTANLHLQVLPDAEYLSLQDFYNNNEEVKIPLKKGVALSDMAARYYQKSKDALTSFEVAKNLLADTEAELNHLTQVEQDFSACSNLEEISSFEEKNAGLLAKLKSSSGKKVTEGPSFIRKEIAGYEVFIGRNAKNNDELLRYAHKEDIWLHARGVGGSHVIIKMDNNKNFPDMSVIRFAAGYAAGYSKSSGSSLAPVMYTKRKHVRKPKGADPGKVIAEKEDVIMVEPVQKQSK